MNTIQKYKNEEKLEKILFNLPENDKSIDSNDLYNLIHLSNRYRRVIDSKLEEPKKPVFSYLSKQDLFSTSREIIKDINEDYVNEFDYMVDNKYIKYNRFPKFVESQNKSSYNVFEEPYKHGFIELRRTFSYSDVLCLIHEFMHHTNTFLSDKNDPRVKKYTEFISIYFEKYALDYMKEEKDIQEEVNLSYRLNNSYNITNVIYSMILVLLYNKNGNLSYLDFKEILSTFQIDINPILYYDYINDLIKMIDDDKTIRDNFKKCKMYLVGTLLVFSSEKDYNKNDVLELNKSLTTNKYDEESVKILEKSYNEVIIDNTIFDNLYDYTKDYKKIKILKR